MTSGESGRAALVDLVGNCFDGVKYVGAGLRGLRATCATTPALTPLTPHLETVERGLGRIREALRRFVVQSTTAAASAAAPKEH